MFLLDRRNLLSAIATTSVCVGTAIDTRGSRGLEVSKASRVCGTTEPDNGLWFLAKQADLPDSKYQVDYWSKPLCTIGGAQRHSQNAAQALLWYEHGSMDNADEQRCFETALQTLGQMAPEWLRNGSRPILN